MRLLIGTFALAAAALANAANACQPLKNGHDHRHWSVQAFEGAKPDVPTYFVGSCWGPWHFKVGRRGVAEFMDHWEDARRSLEEKD